MARLSEQRITQNTKDKKAKQGQEAVLSFFKDVENFFNGTGLSICLKKSNFKDFGELEKGFNGDYFTPSRSNDDAHRIFIKMKDDIKNNKSILTFDDFLPLIKFDKYLESKIQALIFFCNFFEAILQSRESKGILKPLSVVKYEHYLKGIEYLEYAFSNNPSILETLKFKAETKYFLEAKR